jgi:hypothetical protein
VGEGVGAAAMNAVAMATVLAGCLDLAPEEGEERLGGSSCCSPAVLKKTFWVLNLVGKESVFR